jgi:hypothetical protein
MARQKRFQILIVYKKNRYVENIPSENAGFGRGLPVLFRVVGCCAA